MPADWLYAAIGPLLRENAAEGPTRLVQCPLCAAVVVHGPAQEQHQAWHDGQTLTAAALGARIFELEHPLRAVGESGEDLAWEALWQHLEIPAKEETDHG